MATVEALTREWLRLDKDEATRTEILELVKQDNVKELKIRLGSRLAFGTAGLRARMGAGFSRLNSLTIIQTSQGLAQYLLEEEKALAATAGVVIGYDARHNSKKFAELAAAAFIAKGIRVLWYEDLVHTPMVPFAVKQFHAAAGVMITASHNPKLDNGYKVYGSNACQYVLLLSSLSDFVLDPGQQYKFWCKSNSFTPESNCPSQALTSEKND